MLKEKHWTVTNNLTVPSERWRWCAQAGGCRDKKRKWFLGDNHFRLSTSNQTDESLGNFTKLMECGRDKTAQECDSYRDKPKEQDTYKPVTLGTICTENARVKNDTAKCLQEDKLCLETQKKKKNVDRRKCQWVDHLCLERQKQNFEQACDERAKYCKANFGHTGTQTQTSDPPTGAGFGPLKLAVVRQLRRKLKRNGDWESVDVCHFTMSYDVFKCSKNCKDYSPPMKSLIKTHYDEDSQVKGHDCKRWFLLSVSLVTNILQLMTTVMDVERMARCGVDESYWGPGFARNEPKGGCKKPTPQPAAASPAVS